MTAPRHLRLKAAKLRLAYTCAATRGLYVGRSFLDEADRDEPGAVPDALYVTRFNPYDATLLYDVRRGRFLTMAWTDWLEERLKELWEPVRVTSSRPAWFNSSGRGDCRAAELQRWQ